MNLSGDMLLQALINGFTLGWVYVLMALGLTFIMSMARILQLAHGEIYMLGAYAALFLTTSLGLNFYLALVLSMLLMGLLGLVLERFIFRWVSGQLVPPIVISSGLTLMLTSIAVVYFGLYTRSVPRLANGSFVIAGASLAKDKAIVVGLTVCLLGMTLLFLKRSKYGKAMVATAQNREGALLRGIRSNRVASMSFAIASALAGAAGALAGALFQVSPSMGTAPLTKGIVIIVLGGLGSFPGAVVGGLILGLMDGVLPVMFNPLVTSVVPLVIVILVLLLRPRGLFGHES